MMPSVAQTIILTPRSTVFLETLKRAQLIKKFPHFIEPEDSLPHSQQPATYSHPEPDQSPEYLVRIQFIALIAILNVFLDYGWSLINLKRRGREWLLQSKGRYNKITEYILK
jgi:hypothetical protein